MTRLCIAKLLLLVCLAVQTGLFPSAWADSQTGVGVYSRDDYSTAIASELRLLAFQGDSQAQTQLAHLYADGRGVPQNYREAIDWYRRAYLQGYQPAKEALESLGVPLISKRMMSGRVSQTSEGSSPQASIGEGLTGQISHDRNITINIITNVVAPPERHAVEVGGVHSAILLPHNHFKAFRHSQREHVVAKPKFRIGKGTLAARFGKHQKLYPRAGAGRARGQLQGVGRISTR